MKYFHTIFLLVIWLTLCFPVFSQDKDKKTETPLTIKTNLMVVNSKEEFVDVKPEDIKIFEDGVEQKVTKLTKKDSLNVGIVIDNTGSLRSQFPAIIGTANLVVENLRGKDSAFAVRFVSRDRIQIVQEWTSDKNLLKKEINNMYIEGGKSAVIDAIKLSADKISEKKNESTRSVLILMSDLEDRDSYYKVADALKSIKDNGIEVYVIGFVQDLVGETIKRQSIKVLAMDFANNLAAESGGIAFFPKWSKKNQEELIEAAKTTVFEIRSQYVVEYVSTNPKTKDKERKMSVQIADAAEGEKRIGYIRPTINISENK